MLFVTLNHQIMLNRIANIIRLIINPPNLPQPDRGLVYFAFDAAAAADVRQTNALIYA